MIDWFHQIFRKAKLLKNEIKIRWEMAAVDVILERAIEREEDLLKLQKFFTEIINENEKELQIVKEKIEQLKIEERRMHEEYNNRIFKY